MSLRGGRSSRRHLPWHCPSGSVGRTASCTALATPAQARKCRCDIGNDEAGFGLHGLVFLSFPLRPCIPFPNSYSSDDNAHVCQCFHKLSFGLSARLQHEFHKLFADYLQLGTWHLTRSGKGHTLTNHFLAREVHFFRAKR